MIFYLDAKLMNESVLALLAVCLVPWDVASAAVRWVLHVEGMVAVPASVEASPVALGRRRATNVEDRTTMHAIARPRP